MDDTIELLRRQALDWRNVAISAAKREYYSAMKAIRDLERKVRDEARGRRVASVYDQPLGIVRNRICRKTMLASVAEVLGEGKPMSLPKLTMELRRRAVRSRDDPKVVASTDGLRPYTSNVPFAFQSQVDFAQPIKNYASSREVAWYSPATLINIEKLPIFGAPDEDKICTSHIERFNLTYHMNMRRFTRLTNGHSKSLRHHTAMQALFIAWYNFGRKHETLKCATPAMASGLSDHVWTIKELIERAANC